MPLDKNRTQAIDAAIATIERQFGKGAIMRLGEEQRPQIQSISTGSIGLDIEAEADDRFAVRAIPPALGNIDIARLVRDVADDLADEGSGRPAQALVGHVLATLACHSSVRANQSLGIYEMRAMLASLDRVDFSVCAHGRPVAIRIASGELERRFHRS